MRAGRLVLNSLSRKDIDIAPPTTPHLCRKHVHFCQGTCYASCLTFPKPLHACDCSSLLGAPNSMAPTLLLVQKGELTTFGVWFPLEESYRHDKCWKKHQHIWSLQISSQGRTPFHAARWQRPGGGAQGCRGQRVAGSRSANLPSGFVRSLAFHESEFQKESARFHACWWGGRVG